LVLSQTGDESYKIMGFRDSYKTGNMISCSTKVHVLTYLLEIVCHVASLFNSHLSVLPNCPA